MWGNQPTAPHSQLRQEYSDGEAVGPRMVIASSLVDGPNPIWPGSVVVRNAAEGREAVRAAEKAGADFVKVYEMIPADEIGKDADLVLLDANPLVDIHNPTKIRALVASGRLYDRTAVDLILTVAD